MMSTVDTWTQVGPRSEARTLHGSWQLTQAGQIRTVRQLIIEIVSAHTRDPDLSLAATSQRLGIIFAELAANALRHAGGTVMVSLHLGRASWLLSVVDQMPERAPVPRHPDDRPGGLGLVMVGRLSSSVGWDIVDSSKRVWAVVDNAVSPRLKSRWLATGG